MSLYNAMTSKCCSLLQVLFNEVFATKSHAERVDSVPSVSLLWTPNTQVS